MFKKIQRCFRLNPFDKILKEAVKKGHTTFLIPWNRGLGDIALGLYAMVHRIYLFIPEASITFVTRKDLADGFALLGNVDVLAAPGWVRGIPFDLRETMEGLGVPYDSFAVVVENPDPTQWVKWQLGTLVPQLEWSPKWDELWKKFGLDRTKTYISVHVHTETTYDYEKNWRIKQWTELFEELYSKYGIYSILFGMQAAHSFPLPGVVDMRGKTNLFEMLSIIKNCSRVLVAPDSGVLSLVYYLNISDPLHVVSLWADPNQGILKQAVPSPNPQLVHVPLMGSRKDLSKISVEDVIAALVQR